MMANNAAQADSRAAQLKGLFFSPLDKTIDPDPFN